MDQSEEALSTRRLCSVHLITSRHLVLCVLWVSENTTGSMIRENEAVSSTHTEQVKEHSTIILIIIISSASEVISPW
ncbi:hypothetical protein INR49_021225 [Caranx melampygus]|nr:hypothetical protein INR49_021225 [Caranx melampygus]